MQYQIPQFIEIEDQIFGPLTFRQFVYLVGGAGACYTLYRMLPLLIALPLIVAVAVFAGLLAFYKVNNRHFIDVVEAAVKYQLGTKLYLWKKKWNKEVTQPKTDLQITSKQNPGVNVPTLPQSRLKELTWSLDINEKLK